ncbi:MAG: 23S rRNA (guanine2445-N2)-methyltransferase / 23S rRNA (guanine2069-N7)-methyltransferase [Gammaproteobacteria bacterium]|jgi:23S rRNA (guanine2445-N2)-methyltransferase / 23S rRNA (guanine2069-N7)-methyltransferase
MSTLNLFVTGYKGFETLLFHEIRDILAGQPATIKKQYGGISVIGGIEQVYQICLYSRLANRLFCELKQFQVTSEQELYQTVYDYDWSQHITSRSSFAVSATLSRSNLDHSHYVALKTKDAIVDQFRDKTHSRPTIDKQQPDIRIHINIHKNQASLSLDLSGESLHRRGYRIEHSGAPLKEHLGACILTYAGWNADSFNSHCLIDPMCGSGTFAIEAAMMAANIAPGLNRDYFGFTGWLQHDRSKWQTELDAAETRVNSDIDTQILACDYDKKALDIARNNASRAGVEHLIRFQHQDIAELELDSDKPVIIVCNPPYGERLQAEQGIGRLYSEMGNAFKRCGSGAAFIISAHPGLLHRLGLNRVNKKAVKNGPIDCVLAGYELVERTQDSKVKVSDTSAVQEVSADETVSISLLNRLKKNQKHLGRWARKNNVSCFRLYDADLPEFSFALDYYQSSIDYQRFWFHLQEYQAPKTIEENIAAERIDLAVSTICKLYSTTADRIYCKTRRKQRGKQQSQKQGELFQIQEGRALLLVNFSDYLDTGLFLDHRMTRDRVARMSEGKTVLNLFCYTASVSVQAALGGAHSVANVDLSSNSLAWARENFEINDLVDEQDYQFIKADILDLLENPTRYPLSADYDLIFLSPPSFSNSRNMREVLDVEQDHEHLINQTIKLLADDGLLIFSTSKKGFKLNRSLLPIYDIKNVSLETIPEDFKRRPGIHHCFEIRKKVSV